MKRTLKTVATVALAGFVVASCSSLNKMKRLEKNIAYKVTPEMLEAKGGQVDLKIDATIPAKYFNKKVTLVATPVNGNYNANDLTGILHPLKDRNGLIRRKYDILINEFKRQGVDIETIGSYLGK